VIEMKTLKQIETWAKTELAKNLISKYERGLFDHLGINGEEGKYDLAYWEKTSLKDVLDIKSPNSLVVNLIPRGSGTRGIGGYFDMVVTIRVYRKPVKMYTYCCEEKHHITEERNRYFPVAPKRINDAVMRGLAKSDLKLKVIDSWNESSKDYDGGTISFSVFVKNKVVRNAVIKKHEEDEEKERRFK